MNERSRFNTFLLLAFLVLAWGFSWPIYKIALQFTPPLLFAGMRTLFGGLLIAVFYIRKVNLIAWRKNWPVYLISAFLNVIVFYGLQTVGLMYMPSGLFSVIVYLQPVLVGIFAWLWLGEHMTAVKVGGLLLGFLGVAAVSEPGFTGHVAAAGIVMAILTALGWAFGTVYVKRVGSRVDSVWLVTLQCIIGGIVLTAAGSFTESWSSITWNLPFISGLSFGVVIGISASWLVYFKLVQAGDASRVASFTFLVPLIAVLSGSLFLGEPFTIFLLIGLVLIALSIGLVNRKPKPAAIIRSEAA